MQILDVILHIKCLAICLCCQDCSQQPFLNSCRPQSPSTDL